MSINAAIERFVEDTTKPAPFKLTKEVVEIIDSFELIGACLPPPQVEASFEIMGVDSALVDDGTYFAVEHEGALVGRVQGNDRLLDHHSGAGLDVAALAPRCRRFRG